MPTVTAQTILDNASALIDEKYVNGVPISSDTGYIKTLEANGIKYINMASKQVFKEIKNFNSLDIDASLNQNSNDIYTVYTIPDDFAGLEEIINLSVGQVVDYRWVAFNQLWMRNTYLGQGTVVYTVNPTEITATTDVVIVPNPIAEEYINNFVAARLAFKFNPVVSEFYANVAAGLLFKIIPTQPADEEPIEDVHGRYWCGYGGSYGY